MKSSNEPTIPKKKIKSYRSHKKLKSQQVQNQAEDEINEELVSKFNIFLNKCKFEHLKKGVENLYGRDYAIKYQSKFNFHQQWENERKSLNQDYTQELIQNQTVLSYIYTILILLSKILLIWYISIFRLFSYCQHPMTSSIFGINLLVLFLDNWVKYSHRIEQMRITCNCKEFLRFFHKEVYVLCYLIINIVLTAFTFDQPTQLTLSFCLLLFDAATLLIIYSRISALFKHFKIRSYASLYKDHFKLFDLLSTSLKVAHIFVNSTLTQSIIMYCSSYYDLNHNWMTHAGISDLPVFEKYLYSYYFSCTTMLTIGYGDIVPVNSVEIISVLFIQIIGTCFTSVGVAIFVYLINEIGQILSLMRKEEEELAKNISSLAKISKYYNLEKQLTNNAEDYVVNNQIKFDQLYPEEENSLLLKLNDQLRTSICLENYLTIIKTSIFFICHWSKNMQTQVAKRLVKKVFTPFQPIPQLLGKQKVYIVKSGKVQIFTNSYAGHKKQFKRLLRTINGKSALGVSNNIYGYSFVISNRPIRLDAIAKDFTSVYCIDKAQFLECVHDNKLDFEYYSEIKAKIDQSKIREGFQAPALMNVREHYRPNILNLIKKNQIKEKSEKNKRIQYIRNRNHQKRKLQLIKQKICEEIIGEETNILVKNAGKRNEKMDEQENRQRKISQSIENICTLSTIDNFTDTSIWIWEDKRNNFEKMFEYENYFPKSNFNSVLLKYEKQNFQQIEENRYRIYECKQFETIAKSRTQIFQHSKKKKDSK